MRKSVDVLNRPIFVVPLHVVNFTAARDTLKVIEGGVRIVAVGSEFDEIGSVFGVMGDGFKVSEVTNNHDGIRVVFFKNAKSDAPCFLFMSGSVKVRDYSHAPGLGRYVGGRLGRAWSWFRSGAIDSAWAPLFWTIVTIMLVEYFL